MKNLQNSIIVVEGATDVAFLSSFLKAKYIITNGSAISQETIDAIKKLSQHNDIIIMTDPDFPGKQIRDKINAAIPGCLNVFVDKKFCIKKHKVGIAESQRKEVLKALNSQKVFTNNQMEKYSLKSFAETYDLGILSQKFRDFVTSKIGIDKCNSKRFFERLNEIDYPIEEFDLLIKEYLNNGNK